ncbi:MAG: hypothetical protein ACI9J2_001954 [Saprospiraceae bacterium]|jgi:hypothetical protein
MAPQHRTTLNRIISIATAFIVFGFIDNFLMIMFGEQIDGFLRSIGISNTLLAAGLGNTFSDAIGIMSGRWVEKLVHVKLPPVPDVELSRGKIVMAETIGIIIGCLIGLLPLLLF